jgi:hypothetical protein
MITTGKLHWTYLKASSKHLVNAPSKTLVFNGTIFYFSQDHVYILAAQSQLMALQTCFEVLQQVGLVVVLESRLSEEHGGALHYVTLNLELLIDRQDSSAVLR